jgi:tetratricopeptide (TPR) repeat protein
VASAIVSKGEPGGGVAAESEGQRSGSATEAGADPTALGIALGGASRSKADAFLERQAILVDKQIALSDLQIEDLKREDKVRHWSLRIHHISDVLKLGFELPAAAIVTIVVVFIGAAVWNAAHDDGLIIEAFNVPGDMAANGLTGQVIATQLQDRLAWMQAHADTIRAAGTFRNDWGDDIKVQIPDTGISIGEFYRYLAGCLGHETRISGEVWRRGGGVAVSVRTGNDTAVVFRGRETELDALVAKAAEYVYGRTQPYRYTIFLSQQNNRSAEALAATRALALNGPAEEKPWAYSRWGLALDSLGDFEGALEKQRIAAKLNPELPHVFANLAEAEASLGHDEAELRDNTRALVLLRSPNAKQLAAYAVATDIPVTSAMIAEATGDFTQALTLLPQVEAIQEYGNSHSSAPIMIDADLARDHDVAGSMAVNREAANAEFDAIRLTSTNNYSWDVPPLPKMLRAVALDDWKTVRDDLIATDGLPEASSPAVKPLLPVLTWPWLAYADARLGDFAAARALIAETPLDCYLCVRMRGNIDAAQRNWSAAAYWFVDAVKQAPSLPFAYTQWGTTLMAKGDLDGAIAKFAEANKKGPHFADPLVYWGEALIAKNRSDLALAKFEEANKYAPTWGRLHLKWGEALWWSGKKDEAKAQFAVAAKLDLTPSEKSELAKVSAHG